MDVIFAVGLIMISLISILVLQRYIVFASRLAADRLVATNLAQEGFEVVRGIRDNNWKESRAWNYGLENAGEYLVQYDSNSLTPFSQTPLLLGTYYSYDQGTSTKFYRRIVLSPVSSDSLDLFSEVTWYSLGRTYFEIVEGRLYNWR
jgi:hypothetical protein